MTSLRCVLPFAFFGNSLRKKTSCGSLKGAILPLRASVIPAFQPRPPPPVAMVGSSTGGALNVRASTELCYGVLEDNLLLFVQYPNRLTYVIV